MIKEKSILEKQNNNLPLVSIVTVVFNGEKELETTILSVIEQSYNHIEYIIIDGDSQDNTLDIIQKYEAKIDYWRSEPDSGIYDAMNKGIKAATGQIIGLINCGDTYTKNAVSEIVKLYQKHMHDPYLVITGAMYRFDDSKKIEFKITKTSDYLKHNINGGMPINHPATFVTKATYEILNYFNVDYRICGDYDLIYRAYNDCKVKFVFTTEELAYMKLGGISEQFSSFGTRAKEHFLIRKNNLSWIYNFFLSSSWLIKIVMKKIIKYILRARLLSCYYNLRHGN